MNEQVALLPAASVAVQITVVAPWANVEPDGGVQTTSGAEQLSPAMGAGKFTTAEHWPGSVGAQMSPAQTMVGGTRSGTLTVVLQNTGAALPSDTEAVTS